MTTFTGDQKPTALALDSPRIPWELTLHPQWVLWRWELNDEGKWTKPPYMGNQRHASSTDPATWASFDDVSGVYKRGGFDGIGFALDPALGYVGVDLDNVVDPGGAIHPEARRIVDELRSYTERSPSGRGLRIILRGTLPPGWRKTAKYAVSIEVYDHSRYLTITGHHLEGTPETIEARAAEMATLHARVAAAITGSSNGHQPMLAAAPTGSNGHLVPDDDLLDKARAAHNGAKFVALFDHGDTSAHGGDDSAADLALCNLLAFWTGRDATRMDQLFRQSGLMREKWDQRHGAQTYGARTLARAIADCRETYGTDPHGGRLSAISGGIPPEIEDVEAWPRMAPEAFSGVAGDLVRVISPYSEGDPVAALLHVLVAVGNLLGAGAHARVQHDRHPARLFVALVGPTSKGRKGLSWSAPRHVLGRLDAEWTAQRIASGLSSGEGLIWHVRDARSEQQPIRERGRVVDYQTVVIDHGISDKRLLVIEPELASVFKRMAGESNSLSAVLRNAWDDVPLATLTKNSPLRATGAHISLIGHVTAEELRLHLTEVERANGFGNRWMYALVRRAQVLADGEPVPDALLDPLIARLRVALDTAETLSEVHRDPTAAELWRAIYPALSQGEPGLVGAILGRGEAQVLRLSLIYALLDRARAIGAPHLAAALAVWDYCATSARRIFAGRLGFTIADTLLEVLRARGSQTTTELSGVFGRHQTSATIRTALAQLVDAGKVRSTTRDTAGRSVTTWERVA
jgi:Protein of unknown function (DUF3987)